jgi:hypothetical protein
MEIPEQMKKDNGVFFARAKNGSPPDRIAGCENLVENIVATMKLAGENKFDISLDKCNHWAQRAHKDYYEDKDIVKALAHCNAIINEIGYLCYDLKYAKLQSDSFKYTNEVKP